jgi:hypothetical protein
MNLALSILELYIPESMKRKMLTGLFDITSRAFRAAPPQVKGLSVADMLEAYAVFTQEEAEKILAGGQDLKTVKTRLYGPALALGLKLRKRFRLKHPEDVMRMCKILYKTLGISFEGGVNGEVTIAHCFFSRSYTDRICRVISSLDEGVAAGLSGGGKLDFYQRITEGRDCCKARFVWKEE